MNESHARSALPSSPLAASFVDALEGILREESGARVAAVERRRERSGTSIARPILMQERSPGGDAPVHDRFLADHKRLEALLEHMSAPSMANDREHCQELWTVFDVGVRVHLQAEEAHLFPVIFRANERDARVLIREHHHIRARLQEIGAAVDSRVGRRGAMRDFIDELAAHARTEDRLLYEWADASIDEPLRLFAIAALAADLRGPESETTV
jgi:hypothetical protein